MKNGLEWLTAVQRVRPRLIILDDSLPDLEGPGELRALRHRAPEALVVYLATHHTLELERAVRQSGALYYTEKPPDLSLLAKVFAAVFASELEAR
jgi:DNA-binding NarL/FixJ family response regulator